jgi:glycosyltransferase involved in cell wall biosynthesis
VTLIPYVNHPGSEIAIPNKIFQSMAYSTPVVVSDMMSMQQIIEETESGAVFEAGNPSALSESIVDLVRRNKLETAGKNGRSAVENKFNIQKEIKSAIDLVEKITNTNS